jgi:hypothetical protein
VESSISSPDLLAGLAGLAAADDLSVGKDGFNQHFGYGYMTEAALFTAARAALAAAGLSGVLSFPSGQHETVMTLDKDGKERPQILATVTATLTIRDQNGNHIEAVAFGQGMDPADKAYYKAMTGAAKYVVQKALMIAVESDDTDAGSGEAQVAGRTGNGTASDRQLGYLVSLVKKNHVGEQADAEKTAWRLARMSGDTADGFAKINKATASDIIERLKAIEDNPAAGPVVLERLVAWETEQGITPDPVGQPPVSNDDPPTTVDTTSDIPFT